MNFIFGLVVGAAMTSGGGSHAALGSIPFRCLAAFELSEGDYRLCREPTLRREIYDGSNCTSREIDAATPRCSIERHITWEIAGLRELKKGIEQKQATNK